MWVMRWRRFRLGTHALVRLHHRSPHGRGGGLGLPFRPVQPARGMELAAQRARRQAGRDLARGMASHAVTHDVERSVVGAGISP